MVVCLSRLLSTGGCIVASRASSLVSGISPSFPFPHPSTSTSFRPTTSTINSPPRYVKTVDSTAARVGIVHQSFRTLAQQAGRNAVDGNTPETFSQRRQNRKRWLGQKSTIHRKVCTRRHRQQRPRRHSIHPRSSHNYQPLK